MESTFFEDVKQMMREAALMFKESDRKFEAQKAEHDRILEELAESREKVDRKFEELAGMIEESKRIADKVCEDLDKTGLNVGPDTASYFYTALSKSLTFGNICFDIIALNLPVGRRRGASYKFDIILENDEASALIEVQYHVHSTLPEEMATSKVAQFRALCPEYRNRTLYLGIAGVLMDDAVVEQARKFGVGVLKQSGDAIESFDVPLKAY